MEEIQGETYLFSTDAEKESNKIQTTFFNLKIQ